MALWKRPAGYARNGKERIANLSALYDSVTTQILNRMEAVDPEAFVWKPRFTVPDDHAGVPHRHYSEIAITYPWLTKSRQCDKARHIIKSMKNPPLIQQGYDHAAYWPEDDIVVLPDRTRFHSEEYLYATAFHELVHATGHGSRLNRSLMQISFNNSAAPDPREAEEEVLTELTAAFLCAESGIIEATLGSSVAYIQGWASTISPQNTACPVIDLLPAARKTCGYILGDTRN